jgi:PmbA protein
MLVRRAVDEAVRLGASGAEAYQVEERSIQVQFNSEDKNIKTVNSRGIGIRVAFGKRLGMYSTTILDESEIVDAVEKACKIAKAAPEDPDWVSFNQKFGSIKVKNLYDKRIYELGPEDLVERANSAIDLIGDYDEKVNPSTGIIASSYEKVNLTNSSQEDLTKSGTGIAGYIMAKGVEGDKHCNGIAYDSSRQLADFNYDKISHKASERALKFLDARQVEGGEMPVIIRNKVFGSILEVMLSSAINADSVQKGSSPLTGKMNESIAAENIMITDNGRLDSGLNSKPFDDEGHPTQETPIIENGILRSYIYDHYTAQKDKTESTGNGSRGYRSRVRPSLSNLILEERGIKVEEMVEDTRKGLYIESVIGEWLSNTVSGELNATVTHGYLIEDGEISIPVKGLVIAGNFYDIIKSEITSIGNDTASNSGIYSPTVKIAKLSVAGK